MNMRVDNTQLTVFGKFDSLEATPEIVTRLFNLFKDENFLPSFTQVFQVNPQTNEITSIKMPQLNGQADRCIISFLAERMDIKIPGEILQLNKYGEYFQKVLSEFSITPVRLAINTNRIILELTTDEIDAVGKHLIQRDAFPYENSIEWSVRRVSREACSEKKADLVNICENIQLTHIIVPPAQPQAAIVVDTDINTLVNNATDTLNENMMAIFEGMKEHDSKLETALEGILK